MSGGLLNSMLESCEDIFENSKKFNKPMIVFLAGNDTMVDNKSSEKFL